MKFTTFTKTVNIFIIGALCVINIVLLDLLDLIQLPNQIGDLVSNQDDAESDLSTATKFFVGLLSFSGVIALGAIVQGITEIIYDAAKRFIRTLGIHEIFWIF